MTSKNEHPSVLVISAIKLPIKSEKWWRQFDTVIAPKVLESKCRERQLNFIDIETLIDSGNVQEAAEFLRSLSLLKVYDGRRLSKIITYQGYELWWIHYDDLMYKFCLPYTQYVRLLAHLKNYTYVYLYKPPFSDLFEYYLESYEVEYTLESQFTSKLPLGLLFQVFLSIPFLLWAKMLNPKIMVWSSDLFDPPRDHDFRMRFIYEELRKRKICFTEFIRSLESSSTIFKHAHKRKRPVVYSFAINKVAYKLGNFFDKRHKKRFLKLVLSNSTDPLRRFQFKVASCYLQNVSGDIWGIKTSSFILQFLGIKTAIIIAAFCRNFTEVLACKIQGVHTIGILHGFSSKDYNVYDFMPEFDGEKSLSLDKYGVWSEWWRDYYIKYSKVYDYRQLYVSGLMRPIVEDHGLGLKKIFSVSDSEARIKVLFVSEQLASPGEILPYLKALLEVETLSIFIHFRAYRDGFEEWLKLNSPEIIEKIGKDKIFRGNIHNSITACDVVVGSHSTAVLEATLQIKPFVSFHTQKWGDYFELRTFNNGSFFAENPQELVSRVKKSTFVSTEVLKEMQKRFFGDPHRNGSKWVVEEAQKFIP